MYLSKIVSYATYIDLHKAQIRVHSNNYVYMYICSYIECIVILVHMYMH